ncbi:MAG: hypothetical protein LQ338_000498 [Usnochroma carphineum]|nr:MAG: hypothetical protein LQ338_000498 [Usnochroma carphineum]
MRCLSEWEQFKQEVANIWMGYEVNGAKLNARPHWAKECLYLLPTNSADSSPLPDLIKRLATHYNPSPLPRWTLRQLLFRSTPTPSTTDGDPKPSPPRYLQIVSLPDYPNDSHVAITPTPPKSPGDSTKTEQTASVISIPAGPSSDEFTQLLLSKFGPLWQRRRYLAVYDGLAFEVGDFRVKAGELKHEVGGAQLVRGVIVEVAYVGQGGDGQDREHREEMVTAFWEELGVKGAKEFRGSDGGEKDDRFGDAKLSSLNETQESIVSVSQWIMFHRRHADRTCAIWLERMRETTVNKRLTLIYLANEVVQQSKARRKDDFLVAFSPVIAEATATAYKGATNDVQEKIRRTVEVWSQRRIFDKPIQDAVEARVMELDKSRSGKKGGLLGGSLFSSGSSSSAPAELQPLMPLQVALSKANATSNPAVSTANTEFERLTDPENDAPTPPVHAARLSALLKSLSSAESAVAESIKTRQDLIDGLEKLLATNRTALQTDKAQLNTIRERRETTERKKREVEDAIMRGVSASETPSPAGEGEAQIVNGRTTNSVEPGRPKFEELTPPPIDSVTPTGSMEEEASAESQVKFESNDTTSPTLHSDLSPPLPTPTDPRYSAPLSSGSAAKKRKLDVEFEGFGAGEDAMAGLDEEVAELLRAESRGAV